MKHKVHVGLLLLFCLLTGHVIAQTSVCRVKINVPHSETEVVQFKSDTVVLEVPLKRGVGSVDLPLNGGVYMEFFVPGSIRQLIYVEAGSDLELTLDGRKLHYGGELAKANELVAMPCAGVLNFQCDTIPGKAVAKIEKAIQERLALVRQYVSSNEFYRWERLRVMCEFNKELARVPKGQEVLSRRLWDKDYSLAYQKALRGNDSLCRYDWYRLGMMGLISNNTAYRFEKIPRTEIMLSEVIMSYLETVCKIVYPRSPRTAEMLSHYWAMNYVNHSKPCRGIDYYHDKMVADKSLRQEYAQARLAWDKALPGKEVPEIVAEDLSGRKVRLSDLRGKLLYVDFWASWCGPCRNEMRNGSPKLHAAFPNGEVEFVFLSIDKNRSDWEKAVAEDKTKGLHLWIPDAATNKSLKALRVKSYPRYMVVGRDGRIIDPEAPRPSSFRSQVLLRQELDGQLVKEPVDEKRIRDMVYYLADTNLQGRFPGSHGDTLAMEFIRKELFKNKGIKPLGDNGLQHFTIYDRKRMSSLGIYGDKDSCRIYPALNSCPGEEYELKGEVVFLGYGTKEFMDRASLNGRWAMFFDEVPAGVNSDFKTYVEKANYARSRGAIGVIVVPQVGSMSNEMSDVYFKIRDKVDYPIFFGNLNQLKDWGVDMDGFLKGNYKKPLVLKEELYVHMTTIHEDKPTFNVVGMLEGNDPVLKNEVVVIGGHYDHLGRSPFHPEEGYCVGADDNASGVAGVLELARILSKHADLLKRTVVFALFSGEELGLLGSQYFNAYPLYSDKQNVIMLNLDMIGRLGAEAKLYGSGSLREKSEVLGNLALDGSSLIVSDAIKGYADHLSFIGEGVPGIGIITEKHKDYHSPRDTPDKVKYEGIAEIVRYWLKVLDRVAVEGCPVTFQGKDAGMFEASRTNNWFFRTPVGDTVAGIDVPNALNLVRGKTAKRVRVAVIDTGFDTEHPELENILWTNTREIAGDGMDNDGNGFVDDIHGWDFLGKADGSTIEKAWMEADREFMRLKDKYLNGKKKKGKEYEYFWHRVYPYSELARDHYRLSYSQRRNDLVHAMDIKIREQYPDGDVTLDKVDVFAPKDSLERMVYGWAIAPARIARKDSWNYVVEYNKAALEKLKQAYERALENYTEPRNDAYFSQPGHGRGMLQASNMEHGTHVAGIVSQVCSQFPGVDLELMGLRVIPVGDEYDEDVAAAIRYAVDNGAKIINMSLAKIQSPDSKVVAKALRYAEKHDVLIIHAMGNDAKLMDTITYYPTPVYTKAKRNDLFIQVGSVDSCAVPAYSTNYSNKEVDLMAPGVHIYSSIPDRKYEWFNGTSMAAPVVSGIAAVLMAYYPDLTAAQVKEALLNSVYKYDKTVERPRGRYIFTDPKKKYMPFSGLCKTSGVVNVHKALLECEKLNN